MKKIALEFRDFLREYKIVALAIAFVMGGATKELIKSLVDNIIMPFFSPINQGLTWDTAVLNIGPLAIKWGPFLSAVINFMILALVVFLFAKYVLKEEKVKKKWKDLYTPITK